MIGTSGVLLFRGLPDRSSKISADAGDVERPEVVESPREAVSPPHHPRPAAGPPRITAPVPVAITPPSQLKARLPENVGEWIDRWRQDVAAGTPTSQFRRDRLEAMLYTAVQAGEADATALADLALTIGTIESHEASLPASRVAVMAFERELAAFEPGDPAAADLVAALDRLTPLAEKLFWEQRDAQRLGPLARMRLDFADGDVLRETRDRIAFGWSLMWNGEHQASLDVLQDANVHQMNDYHRYETEYLIGMNLISLGRPAEAIPHLEQAEASALRSVDSRISAPVVAHELVKATGLAEGRDRAIELARGKIMQHQLDNSRVRFWVKTIATLPEE